MKLLFFVFFVYCVQINTVLSILGGNPSEIRNHPYQVAILANGKFISSGIIIQNNLILTDISANRQMLLKVIHPDHEGSLSIRAGSTNSDNGGVIVNVTRSRVIKTDVEDFSVLYLERPLEFSDSIASIETAAQLPDLGASCTISGWGVTNASNLFNLAQTLNTASVSLVGNLNCQAINNSTEPAIDGELCLRGGDACIGDSGAPLVCNGKLVGVASSFPHCNVAEFTGSYIDIQTIRDELLILQIF